MVSTSTGGADHTLLYIVYTLVILENTNILQKTRIIGSLLERCKNVVHLVGHHSQGCTRPIRFPEINL